MRCTCGCVKKPTRKGNDMPLQYKVRVRGVFEVDVFVNAKEYEDAEDEAMDNAYEAVDPNDIKYEVLDVTLDGMDSDHYEEDR